MHCGGHGRNKTGVLIILSLFLSFLSRMSPCIDRSHETPSRQLLYQTKCEEEVGIVQKSQESLTSLDLPSLSAGFQ
jgi:hypothetical protein